MGDFKSFASLLAKRIYLAKKENKGVWKAFPIQFLSWCAGILDPADAVQIHKQFSAFGKDKGD